MHALWNSIGKRSATSIAFYAWATMAGTILFSPLMINNWDKIINLPARFWGLLVISGGFQTLYFTGLAKAYKSAELSLVYPLARSLPVLIVPVFVLFAYGETGLSSENFMAMGLIVLGALVIPLRRWQDWHIKTYLSPAVGWALIAAIGTAGYSITDSEAIYVMRNEGWQPFAAGSSFVVLQGLSISIWMLGQLKYSSQGKIGFGSMCKKSILLTGFFLMATYLLVLMSMSMVDEISYIVALRQLSIPIGVAIGAIWLKEHISLPKIKGVSLMLIGLVLVAL
ncbi:MAG: putative membrane protein [Oceanospirillaceae bacterium]|jgi:uncharacterized membrane protein